MKKNGTRDRQDFTLTLLADLPPSEAFEAINDVRAWWSEDFEGRSQALGDEFAVRFGDVHFSRQRLVEVVPGKKVVWLVTDSHLSFVDRKSEWTGTRISFELTGKGNQTQLRFTHLGLVPSFECFGGCSEGWSFYLRKSLAELLRTGQGQPHRKEAGRAGAGVGPQA